MKNDSNIKPRASAALHIYIFIFLYSYIYIYIRMYVKLSIIEHMLIRIITTCESTAYIFIFLAEGIMKPH